MDQPDGPIGQRIVAYLAERVPSAEDLEAFQPRDMLIEQVGSKHRFMPPFPEAMLVSLELLDTTGEEMGVKFERGLLYLDDTFGTSLAYQPLWVSQNSFTIAMRMVWPRPPRDNTPTTEGGPDA